MNFPASAMDRQDKKDERSAAKAVHEAGRKACVLFNFQGTKNIGEMPIYFTTDRFISDSGGQRKNVYK